MKNNIVSGRVLTCTNTGTICKVKRRKIQKSNKHYQWLHIFARLTDIDRRWTRLLCSDSTGNPSGLLSPEYIINNALKTSYVLCYVSCENKRRKGSILPVAAAGEQINIKFTLLSKMSTFVRHWSLCLTQLSV